MRCVCVVIDASRFKDGQSEIYRLTLHIFRNMLTVAFGACSEQFVVCSGISRLRASASSEAQHLITLLVQEFELE